MKNTKVNEALKVLRRELNNFKRRRNNRRWSGSRFAHSIEVEYAAIRIDQCLSRLRLDFERLEKIEKSELVATKRTKSKLASRNAPQSTT